MKSHHHAGRLLAVLAAGLGLVLVACSSSSPAEPTASAEPTATVETTPLTVDEYLARVQTLHDTQEAQSEAIGQRFAAQLSGDETNIEDILESLAETLPLFFPDFQAVLAETRDGLAVLAPPPVAEAAHSDLIAAYDEFDALIERGIGQLDAGESPAEVMNALFVDRAATVVGQHFIQVADELFSIAEAEGVEGFVGGGALAGSAPPPPAPTISPRTRGDATPVMVPGALVTGPGISVDDALSNRAIGPLLVNGFLLIRDGETPLLCQTLAESHPPACGAPSLLLEGFEPDPTTLSGDSGVTWTSNQIQVFGEVRGETLVAGGTAIGPALRVATWPAGTETGVEIVDRVVAAAVAGDPTALARLVHYGAVPCVDPADAGEGQLQCDENEAAGTPIEVMLAAHCEGVFLRPSQVEPWLDGVLAEELGLHGAYVEEPARTAARIGSAGLAYVAVLGPRSEEFATVTLIVDADGLSLVLRSCGDPAIEVIEGGLIPHGAEVLLAPPE